MVNPHRRRTTSAACFCSFALLFISFPALRAQQSAPAPPPIASLHGVVMDRDGEVCQGATVRLATPAATVLSTQSDATGTFAFSGIPAGNFSIAVSAQGFAVQKVTGSASAGQELTLDPIVLTPESTTSEVLVSGSDTVIAIQELREEEKQRVLGVVPNFTVVYDHNAPPLSTSQKYQLALRVSVDPFTFFSSGLSVALQKANGDYKAYGEGVAGYSRRYAADYGNNLIGTMLGGAVLPSILHQDPRYFYKGTGSATSRVLYAFGTAVVCKGDNGRWQPNYSDYVADFAAAGISDSYYPSKDRSNLGTISEDFALNTLANAIENVFQEFVVRRFTRHKPTYDNSSN